VPVDLHKQLPQCDFFYLIRGKEREALNFFQKNGCKTVISIRNKYAKRRFERFLIGYNENRHELYFSFYNIASSQRIRHYELLLKLMYGKKISKKIYKIVYPNNYLEKFKKIIQPFSKAKKIIIGYKNDIKRIIRKIYKRIPDIDIEDDFFSLSYYKNERLIITGHAFGWMMKEIILSLLRMVKIRQVFYIGNCGTLEDLKIGQIIFPNNLFYLGRRKIVVNNILFPQNNYSIRHLSVSTPFVETHNFITENRKKYKTIDVELYDIAKNILNTNKNIKLGIALLVSDKPGKKENKASVCNEYYFQRSLQQVLEEIIKLVLPNESR